MPKKYINIGHTNLVKYIENNNFYLEKKYNGFNHVIDYTTLSIFPFVPKLISNDEKQVVWKEIANAHHINNLDNDALIKIAHQMRKIHLSDLKFPKNNFRKRVKEYLRIIHDKKLHIPIIENKYKEMTRLITRMNRINPCHNDLRGENILIDKKKNIWFVDWEYATMGDKHFDLAYFINSSKLNSDQEKIFLNAYDEFDDYQAYNPKFMIKYKRFCHWLTICWAYAQPKMPFKIDWMIDFLEKNK